jgi:hypothetical protein
MVGEEVLKLPRENNILQKSAGENASLNKKRNFQPSPHRIGLRLGMEDRHARTTDPEMRRAASPKAAPKSQSNLHTDENSKLSPAIQVARRHREKLSLPFIKQAIRRRLEMERAEDYPLDREIEEHGRKVFESYEDDLLALARLGFGFGRIGA